MNATGPDVLTNTHPPSFLTETSVATSRMPRDFVSSISMRPFFFKDRKWQLIPFGELMPVAAINSRIVGGIPVWHAVSMRS